VANQRDRVVVGHGAKQVAERRATKAQRVGSQPVVQLRVEHAGVPGWLSEQYRVGRIPDGRLAAVEFMSASPAFRVGRKATDMVPASAPERKARSHRIE